MDSYNIQWKRSAEKDLRSIDRQYISRILEAVESLSDNPFPVQHCKLYGTNFSYRIRIGNYRVVYQVDSEKKVITVFHVRHRKDIYRRDR
ncbi:MAG: type II toxin-antitoxin system RelE/ParE family toxin [Spirochaetes bacterium]|nr:MAG: type II toxin-antitoxin system RelE/ParE family toxin [Spirochaetota bacterium]